jgi:hypothetical protein
MKRRHKFAPLLSHGLVTRDHLAVHLNYSDETFEFPVVLSVKKILTDDNL